MSIKEKNAKVLESVNTTVSVEIAEVIDEKLPWSAQFKSLWHSRRAVHAGAVACSSAAVLIGYDLTLMGPIIANKEFVFTFGTYDDRLQVWTLRASRQLVWTIVGSIAGVLGAVGVGFLNNSFGRRFSFLSTVALTIIGTVVEVVSTNWKVWTLAKVFFGIAIGFMQGSTPVYVSEISPVHIRGSMLSLFQFWTILGPFFASCVLEGTSTMDTAWSWKAAVLAQLRLGLLCLLLFIPLVPESPYYLVAKSRKDLRRAALLKSRANELNYVVDDGIKAIEDTLVQERKSQENAGLGFPLCGAYLAYFLSLSGISNPFVITIICIALSMLAVMCAFSLIERVGRRPQLIIGTSAMLPCLVGMGVLGFVNRGSLANSRALAAISIL
ncbi:high-affinity glucose transporter HXT2 [Lipomyces kononenkoae]|uniref:High-affinity glucose transporter HXT2 n=1 Tax=Lipomyces kononenkoae TaxID=34357 RepID=A0ACC3T6W4_LIPKO